MSSVPDAEVIMASDQPASGISPKLGLPAWIPYKLEGPTRFSRLLFIGSVSSVLATEALVLAVHEALSGKNVEHYENAVRALAEVSPEEEGASLDPTWIQKTQISVNAQTERLELELKGYKNNLIKESIRMGHEDLGNHYFQTGNLSAALIRYSRMREHCTTIRQLDSMYFKLIITNIEAADWSGTLLDIGRLKSSHTKPEELEINSSKLSIAQGLARMNSGDYHKAAESFLDVTVPVDDFNMVASANDIAIYGSLCALATMSRDEIKTKVLDSSQFQSFLDLEPQMRRALNAFYNSKFYICFRILTDLRTDFLLDIHLSSHLKALFDLIRLKSIKQYLIPFSCVTFKNLATVFSSPGANNKTSSALPSLFIECPYDNDEKFRISSTLIKELIGLIERKDINYLINMETQTLDHTLKDQRSELIKEFSAASEKLRQELYWRATAAQASKIQAGGYQTSSEEHDEPMERFNPSAELGI
ncbi:26S proteasome regulatory subunit Rpn7 [Penicillium taxi]|uniref:26S proteasome regulatory subunit Rpn7 n=1 Tax=Penicillium taxi TaxID=168475 RepID=UPI00254541E7|nr:26S proteasome regulatory subunit Rpn7 [Penicillium taxi]KAJ5899877.1 26S proteasome regulatory subunit Rpn7 [Penicillium taxi]